MLSDGSSTSATLVLAAAARAASTDPSGVVGWLPAVAAFGGGVLRHGCDLRGRVRSGPCRNPWWHVLNDEWRSRESSEARLRTFWSSFFTNLWALFGLPHIRLVQLLFSAGTVFFSHNNSAGTVFFSQFQSSFRPANGAMEWNVEGEDVVGCSGCRSPRQR